MGTRKTGDRRRHGVVTACGLLTALALLGAAPAGQADDGAIPVWEPTTISQPGHYVLTRDIVSASNPVVSITASNVRLDLNGFRIEGNADIFAADVVLVSGISGVVIENGSVVGGGAGIRFSTNSSQFVLRNLAVSGGRTGIGIASNSARGVIEKNIIQDCTDDGISASGNGMQIRDNVVSASINGIVVDSCSSCQVTGNTVRNAAITAISLNAGSGNFVVGNTISGSGTGIRVSSGGYHLVENNLTTGNTSFGLHLRNTSFQNVYRRNVSRNNAGTGCTGVGNADFCDAGAGNTSSGDNYMPDQR